MAGQSIMDRVVAARHSIAGQGLAKSVCKATTEELMGPKKKHIDYLLQCTNEPNVSIPQMADLLIERTQHSSWVVVFKALISINNLMNYGNERFTQYLASNNCTFNLSQFLDKGGVQGYDMSTFIRRYAKYLNEKAVSYRSMAFDFCKVKRGKDDGMLRTMNSDKLLKALPVLQQQLDALLEFDCTPNELTNGVINACFMLLFKDMIRLFACYNDGIINLLEKYFDMNKKQCKDALDVYKKFLVRMDKVSEFLKVAENVGIDKGDIPDLAKGMKTNVQDAPSSLLDALEQHLASLEGKKATTKPADFATAVNSISSNTTVNVSDDDRKRIIDEESHQLQQLKEHRIHDANSSPTYAATGPPEGAVVTNNNPFGSPTQPVGTMDAFGAPSTASRPSNDLLSLNRNPFVDNVQNVMTMNNTVNTMSSPNSFGEPTWQANAKGPSFASDDSFATAFNTANSTNSAGFGGPVTPYIPTTSSPAGAELSFDPLDPLAPASSAGVIGPAATAGVGDLGGGFMAVSGPTGLSDFALPPSPARSPLNVNPTFLDTVVDRASPALSTGSDTASGGGFDAFGAVLQPLSKTGNEKKAQEKLIAGDLDSSLAQLAGNLNMNGPGNQVKKTEHQWQPKGEHKKTGGMNWQSPTVNPASTTWTPPQQTQPQPQQAFMPPNPMAPGAGPRMAYAAPAQGPPNQFMAPMGQPQGMMPAQPMGMAPGQPAMYGGIQPAVGQPIGFQQQPSYAVPQTQNTNDPFGAL